ncbi:MAG: tRNA (adenosine(37)-N6)-threonylcarbamoyltransferase complex dimerization subunit type 1 TsaB [Myxococcales bacterium]|nr:tRNA (adenosine(37)-N6)-threonylcarbamoyltransferase complex dimerization subunit type 1 TsaB [Myxococcales bacterium]
MKLLGLDTATLTSGIAVLDGERVLAESRHDASGRTADLLVAIDATCKRAGVLPGELDAVAVGAGPGSFTGLRIGMATAKGIAFAAGKPLWAVSSLAALAWNLPGFVVAVLDARKGEVYAGCYRDGLLVDVERVLAPTAVAPWVAGLAGEDTITYVGDLLAPEVTTPSGVAVARLALAGLRVDVVTGGAPTYIRKAEAEVMYPDGVPGAMRRPEK